MTKRTAKFVSAIAASFLAGAPLTTPSHSASADCLSGPKDQTPQGSHWYYHIDHTTKRHCWYLADEREKSSHASSASAKSAPHKPEDTLPRKVADAHAELATADNTERLNRRNTANSPIVTPPSEGAPLAEEQSTVISSRWPNQALPDASVIPSPNKADQPQLSSHAPTPTPKSSWLRYRAWSNGPRPTCRCKARAIKPRFIPCRSY